MEEISYRMTLSAMAVDDTDKVVDWVIKQTILQTDVMEALGFTHANHEGGKRILINGVVNTFIQQRDQLQREADELLEQFKGKFPELFEEEE
jgi:hypothetical protein